jgi:hypothetical protein
MRAYLNVIQVTLFPAWRSPTVSNGRLRSSADTRDLADASGRCLHLADIGRTVDTEPGEGRRRCRAESPEVPGKLKIAVPVWDVLTYGVSSPSTPHRLNQRQISASWVTQGKQGPTVAERVGGASAPPPTMTRPGDEPHCCPSPRKESQDGQAAVPVGAAVRAG